MNKELIDKLNSIPLKEINRFWDLGFRIENNDPEYHFIVPITQTWTTKELIEARKIAKKEGFISSTSGYIESYGLSSKDILNLNTTPIEVKLPKVMKKIYLGISYSGMEESSFDQVTEATAMIINELEYNVFSPITHSHHLVKHGSHGSWDFWQRIDYQFLDFCDEAWFLIPKEGEIKLLQSTGVCAEITYAKTNRKPVKFVKKVGNKIVEYGK